MKNTCPNDVLLAPTWKRVIFCIESRMSIIQIVACPIQATVISLSFQRLARMWFLLAPGNRASAYVAPCPIHIFHVLCLKCIHNERITCKYSIYTAVSISLIILLTNLSSHHLYSHHHYYQSSTSSSSSCHHYHQQFIIVMNILLFCLSPSICNINL